MVKNHTLSVDQLLPFFLDFLLESHHLLTVEIYSDGFARRNRISDIRRSGVIERECDGGEGRRATKGGVGQPNSHSLDEKQQRQLFYLYSVRSHFRPAAKFTVWLNHIDMKFC
ncbi:hypothetical protein EVAR_78790_1 [Eumeta japonica]|uniref:Uncharacterized protein n=1 Tax=Eumeta variegata TaxID=151549 RepID=A0A4C1T1B1_EUMVA|nr:hypothetical protein EVAR_78790_1 [Eumeta japonica]